MRQSVSRSSFVFSLSLCGWRRRETLHVAVAAMLFVLFDDLRQCFENEICGLSTSRCFERGFGRYGGGFTRSPTNVRFKVMASVRSL